MITPPELDEIAKVVLAYHPKPKSAAAKKRVRRAKRISPQMKHAQREIASIENASRGWSSQSPTALLCEPPSLAGRVKPKPTLEELDNELL
jgi:hypothetical protein